VFPSADPFSAFSDSRADLAILPRDDPLSSEINGDEDKKKDKKNYKKRSQTKVNINKINK
jgi:hypothetical protein